PVTMTFTRRSCSVSGSRTGDLGDAADLEHAIVCDCCTLPTTRQAVGAAGASKPAKSAQFRVGCTRCVATFTWRKPLAPSRGFRTKTEPLVTRSLWPSKYCSFRMLQDHPGGTLPG